MIALAVATQTQDLIETFLAREPLLPGSLYTLRRRCGKPTCHCNDGELHASTVLSYRGQGRPRNISPPAATALAPGPRRGGTRAGRRTPV